jgi:threonine dehydrogenase-like Zn-dependent dehydrogenase
VEPSATRRALAERLGADVTHEPGRPIVDLLAEVGFAPSTISPLLDDSPEVVSVFECVGRPAIVGSVLAEAPPHAHVVLAGACAHPVEMQPLELTTREVTVDTSFAYRPSEFVAAADHLRSHPDIFEQMITSERPLEDAAAAFDALANEPSEIKILITPTG